MPDGLDLLFKIRGDSTGAKDATDAVRNAIKDLRSTLLAEFGAMEAAVAGGIAGFALLAGGVAVVAKGIFDLASATAEFQGKFQDLSQQVGVSVETLSTLDVLASTTGGNIDTVTGSLALFQKQLEAAHDPTSKQAKLFSDLGVTSSNTEVALRQTLKALFDLGEGEKQTALALEAFGRSGRFFNAILKESNGNIDEATKKLETMGLVVTSQAAAAADAFNDSLEILNRQLANIGYTLGSFTIPVLTIFIEDISKALTGSQNSFGTWGDFIETEIAIVIGTLEGFVTFVATRFTVDLGTAIDSSIRALIERAQRFRNELFIKGESERFTRLADSITGSKLPGAVDKAELERFNKELAFVQKQLEEQTKEHRETLERERRLDLISLDEYVVRAKKDADDHYNGEIAAARQAEAIALKFITNQQELNLKLKEIEADRRKARFEHNKALQDIDEKAQKERDQSLLKIENQLLAIRDAEREAELKQIQDQLDRGEITESAAIAKRLVIETAAAKDRQAIRDLEYEQQSTSAARKIELDNEKIQSEQKLTDETKRLTKERLDAIGREAAERAKVLPVNVAPTHIPIDELPPSPFDPVNDAFKELKAIGKDALDSLASGIGSLVQSWVLLGDQSQASMRKVVAAVLAGVAAQAATQAILFLAYGLAALTPWGAVIYGPATQWFQAAALMASVAVVAGVAGRAVAGSSFQQKSSTSPGGGAGGGGSAAGTTSPSVVDINRRALQPERQIIELRIKGDLSDVIEHRFIDRYTQGGRLRNVLQSDGQG